MLNGSSLQVTSFAHLAHARVDFGDLTVLVGPQATGKSLALQLWKLVLDRGEIVSTLKGAGFTWQDDAEFLQHVLGQGWTAAWTPETTIEAAGRSWSLSALRTLKGKPPGVGRVFYVPAQRTLVLDNGWPRQFQQFTPDTPYVVRQFSQTLHGVIGGYAGARDGNGSSVVFPHGRRLKEPLKKKLDEAVYHGARLTLSALGMRWQLGLEFDEGQVKLGFMSWTAGQREVSPLLLSLYHLLPAGRVKKREGIDWVVIEEPEMGLHPKAVLAVLLIVLDLVARGYKVVLSTHAPIVLDVLFAIRNLQAEPDKKAAALRLLAAFDVTHGQGMTAVATSALAGAYKVFAFDYDASGGVTSEDISDLDPSSSRLREATWGGLTGLSSQVAHAAFDGVSN